MYLLDTNVVSEARKPGADPRLVTWLSSKDSSELRISAITLLELEIGVLRMERKDSRQGERLRAWLEGQVAPAFASQTISVDAPVARRAAALHVPDPRPQLDALIAATALVHRLTLVTRNTADFRSTGVDLIDPWI